MPRSTRSSTRASKAEDNPTPQKAPKKQTQIANAVSSESTAPHARSLSRPSRKNPTPSPQSARSSKRLKRSEEHSPSDEEMLKTSSSKIKKTGGRRNSNYSVDASATKTNDSLVPTRRSKRALQDSTYHDTPSPKKKTHKQVALKRNRKSVDESKILTEDEEIEEKRPRTDPPKVILKPPLPRKLSRVELYDEALKNLASRIDMFDLTDPAEAINIWCDWPTQDGPLSFKDLQALLLNRIWFSASGPNSNTSSSLVNGNGLLTKENCATGPNKEIDVISYCLSHLTPSSPDFKAHKDMLEKELAAYKADVYCFQNAEPDCQTFLRDLLQKQACTFSTISGSNLIAFQLDRLTLLSQHKVSAMDFAKQAVLQCAYPTSWCRIIQKALTSSHFDEMLVTVLMHKATNQVILVASHSLSKKEVRPDITALNITGALWNLARIWQEQNLPIRNGQANGCEINGHSKTALTSPRWLLCGPFNASERSPIYQLARDGYPNDITLDRLRCLKNISLPTHVSLHVPPIDPEAKEDENELECAAFKNKALIDLLWNAFQHPCSDVTSCYQAVVGREPPFTRLTSDKKMTGPRDYIWCSGTTLQPHTVLMPPCRGLTSALGSKLRTSETSAIPLMARMSLISTAS